MFTPSQLEQIPIYHEGIMYELEERIMEDIIRRIRINDEITRSADWQIYRLRMIGENMTYIQNQIQRTLKLSDAELERIYSDVIQSGYARDKTIYEATGKKFITFAENMELQQLINAIILQTKDSLVNITQSLGFAIETGGNMVFTPISAFYQQILDRSVMEITSGAFDYNTTLRRAIQDMTKSGIRSVDYASGWNNRIEVATRRAVMTGITQVTGQINDINAQALETDYFEVSWHATARPSHQVWQGRVYSKAELESVCGLGTGPGLLGWNCYHSYYPFVHGVSKRLYTDRQLDEMNKQENTPISYNGKQYTKYEATQKQRQLETLMRKQRQDIVLLKKGGASEDDIINARSRYRSTMAQYSDFSERMELPQQKERVYMDGLGRA